MNSLEQAPAYTEPLTPEAPQRHVPEWLKKVATVGTTAVMAFGVVKGALPVETAHATGQTTTEHCQSSTINGVTQTHCTTETFPTGDITDGTPPLPLSEEIPEAKPFHSPREPRHRKPKSHDSPTQHKTVSINMNKLRSPLNRSGCGIVSLTDNVRYLTGKKVSPYKIMRLASKWYSPSGEIKVDHYMSYAAPKVAKHYGLKSYETNLNGAARAIKRGGAAIVLANPGTIFTGTGHYWPLQNFKNGRFKSSDPNQRPGRPFNNSWHSKQYLLQNGVQPRVWVMAPKENS